MPWGAAGHCTARPTKQFHPQGSLVQRLHPPFRPSSPSTKPARLAAISAVMLSAAPAAHKWRKAAGRSVAVQQLTEVDGPPMYQAKQRSSSGGGGGSSSKRATQQPGPSPAEWRQLSKRGDRTNALAAISGRKARQMSQAQLSSRHCDTHTGVCNRGHGGISKCLCA